MKFTEELIPIYSHVRSRQRYLSLGYEEKDDYFYVNCNDLPHGSPALEKRRCDNCGKEYIREHEKHEVTFERFGEDVCPECVKNDKQFRQKIVDKREKTCKEKYGCHPMQVPEIKENLQKYFKEKYGGHPMQNEEVKKNWEKTLMEKYGGLSPLCSEEVREKAAKTMSENNLVPTSSQQIKIFNNLQNLYQDCTCFLNYPESKVYLDVLFEKDNVKIDVEYDGKHWHKNRQKEDRRRDEFLKNKNYKILRIKSAHDIPTDEYLKEKIDELLIKDKKYSEIILSDW